MSFREFRDELLMAMVLAADTKPGQSVEPFEAARARKLEFRQGWLRQAVQALHDEGLIRTYFTLGGGEHGGMSSFVTGAGIEEAEDIANRSGFDLYDDVSDFRQLANVEQIEVPASDRVVKIDHNSTEFAEISSQLDRAINSAKLSNSIRATTPDEAEQHIAELEAGKRLISAAQADRALVERLLVPALKWIGEKIADNIVNILIGGLITALAAYFGFAL